MKIVQWKSYWSAKIYKMLSECKEIDATIIQTVGSKEFDGMAMALVK